MTAQQDESARDTGKQNEPASDKGNDQERKTTEKPEVTDEHREKAAKLMESYEDRPTAVMPGTKGTMTGTAVNEWLDDEGNPKFGEAEEIPDDDSADTPKDSGDTPKDE